ncbi:MAG: GGDEF domain-containing protein [Candidatus Latescibacterota bacterium]
MSTDATDDRAVDELRAEIDRLTEENERLRASNRRWMRIAGTDALTGLPNKVYFSTALLPQLIVQADAQAFPFSCLIVAPDGLGEINHRHGREAGDDTLRGVAAFLKEGLEAHERLLHLDGANFVLVLLRGDLPAAKRRALALRARLVSRPFRVGSEVITLTMCMGTVCRNPDPAGESADAKAVVEALLTKLTAVLDRAKREGPDKLVEDPQTDF